MFLEACLFYSALFAGAGILKKFSGKVKKKSGPKAAKLPDAEVLPYLSELETKYQKFIQDRIDPLFGSTRHQQMKSLSLKENLSDEEKEVNRNLGIAVVNTGLAAAAEIFYPPLLIATVPALVYFALKHYQNAYRQFVKEHRVVTSLLDGIIVTGMLLSGYFFTTCVAGIIIQLYRKLLSRTKDSSQEKLIRVFSRHPRSVWIRTGNAETEIPFEDLRSGDIVVVNAGEIIPADGIIREGGGLVAQQSLTGESVPSEKSIGDPVFASTMLLSGRILISAEKAGNETVAAKIGAILNRTVGHKTALESGAEKFVDRSTLPTIALSGLAYTVAGSSGALGILYSGIGYIMRVIGPLSTLNFLRIASQSSILVKDGYALEKLAKIDTFVFDKTGTLTSEQPFVKKIHSFNGFSEDMLLMYAAAAEYRQTHPVALAVLSAAAERKLKLPDTEDGCYEIGFGIRVRISGLSVMVGSRRFMETENIPVSDEIKVLEESCGAKGYSLVMIAVDSELTGAIELHPTTRPHAKEMIRHLRQQNIGTYIISGDQEQPTRALAEELMIDHWFAETLPEQKAEIIERLKRQGKTVCFVGDGINDSIALRKADVSVSLCGASTAAVDTAQIVLMDGNLGGLIRLLDIVRNFDSNQKVNMMISIIPGIICIGGVFLLDFGIYAAMMLYYSGLIFGVGNATRPMLTDGKQEFIEK